MESVFGRYRNLTILVGVLFLQVLGLAVQVKRSADAENTRLIRIWAVDAITPLERAVVWAQNGCNNLWHNYFFLRGVRAENRQLKQQIEQMRLEQVRLSEDAGQAHRLQSLLGFKEQYIAKTVAAQVIGSSGSDLSRSIYIDKGSNQGIAQDMAVITAGGIVGKVLRVYPSTSLVLLINDQSSGVGVLLEKSRLQGVLRGTPNGELSLERVTSDETVSPGDTVLSSGGDQIFPKGLPVGTVTKVGPGREMFLSIKVKPAADLSRLEEVLVVTQKQERSPVAEDGTQRAADILAARLPSVPDKPPAVAGAAAAGSAVNPEPLQGKTAGAKPQPNSGGKPVAAAGTKLAGGVPVTSLPAARHGAGAHSATVTGQPPTDNVVKKAARSGASATTVTSSGIPAVISKSANSPAKAATAQPKPAGVPPSPHPPATEDSPH
ncbi:MAG: rod shape-determining protein MreC [Candidatus Sulfotelmatobacter sp.]